jgi:anti-sigma factor RsiW
MTGCAYVEPRLRALADGELEGREQRRVLEHLDDCARCQAAHARIQSVAALLHEQELEEVPAHFTTDLQVRLARHRKARAEEAIRRRPSLLEVLAAWTPRRRWTSAALTAAVTAGICFFAFNPGIGASEVARRAELSWAQIRNYGCVFESRGVYQGQERTFRQRQFFRRPGEFRLDTSQDYPLTTFVYPDRVIQYLPGGDWEGRGPLAIVRPRREGQDALPFPFGVTWQNGGNVSLDQLIRQLTQNQGARLLPGTERVGERDCYHLDFTAVPPGGSSRDLYGLWIDKDSFLPRRVSWFRDSENHIITEARDLQVNYEVLPAGTFEFTAPEGTLVIHGDVDPHVLALPFQPARTAEFDRAPVFATQEEAFKRCDRAPFPVLAPDWLPKGYSLIRVRGRSGRWVDMHWIRQEGRGKASVVKLLEQDAAVEPADDLKKGEPVTLRIGRRRVVGRMVVRTEPYRQVTLTWRQGGTRCTLFAAEMDAAEVKQIAASTVRAHVPSREISVAENVDPKTTGGTEPSALPVEPESAAMTEEAPAASEATSAPATDQPPMMPEMADEDARK